MLLGKAHKLNIFANAIVAIVIKNWHCDTRDKPISAWSATVDLKGVDADRPCHFAIRGHIKGR